MNAIREDAQTSVGGLFSNVFLILANEVNSYPVAHILPLSLPIIKTHLVQLHVITKHQQ